MRTLERTFRGRGSRARTRVSRRRMRRRAPRRWAPPRRNAAMDTIAARSLEAYRSLVFTQAGFFEYFRAATPLDVIERMHIGSRPGHRAAATASTRCGRFRGCSRGPRAATCCRAGSGSAAAWRRRFEQHGTAQLAAMLADWPFFGHLARRRRGDAGAHRPRHRAHYDALAGEEFAPSRRRSAASTRSRCARAAPARFGQLLDAIRRCSARSAAQSLHRSHASHAGRSIEALARDRARGPALFGALRATISGIAQGCRRPADRLSTPVR
jgi:phosphoenolpyruvate carboxylase